MSKPKLTLIAGGAVAAALVLALALGAPPGAQKEAAAPAEAAPAADAAAASHPAITVAPVALAVLKDRVRASGLVGAVEQIMIQPQVEGQAIDRVNADVGDRVKAGDVLAELSETALRLQKTQLEASLASARAAIAQSQAQLIEARAKAADSGRARDRAEQMKAQGNVSQVALDQAVTAATAADAGVEVASQTTEAATAQLAVVKAQIDNIDLQLSRTKITAPADGQIVQKNALAGSIASAAGQPMFVLIRDGKLELNADVAEQDLPRLAAGQRVAMRASGTDAVLTGTVRLVEPAIDPVSRLGRARIDIDQASQVRSGTFLEADIAISEREVPAIPINALGTDAQGSYVMTVDGQGKVHRTTVVTGVRDGGLVEVVSGVAAGTQVVAKAASFVRDGDIVNPVAETQAPATN
ncbi:MAG: efflux RND transporter periplasmic adaptor subunit [Proteobacteria bacterium]|nr:efflux RND transporter periplasmic adaptor subunit [Pseudomonadota bacterium]MBS0573680.1 efflux RND transporter periplasmic adaptor subunit [Pseudomonadota bacterium]